jgi:hypothetical protein
MTVVLLQCHQDICRTFTRIPPDLLVRIVMCADFCALPHNASAAVKSATTTANHMQSGQVHIPNLTKLEGAKVSALAARPPDRSA